MDEITKKQSIPWERKKELGFFRALWQTIIMVLFKPNEFFSTFEVSSYIQALSFNLITTSPLIIHGMFLGLLITHSIFSTVFSIFPVVVLIFVVTAFFHFLGILTFRGKGGFLATFNVFAYAGPIFILGAIFRLIPFVGNWIAVFWLGVFFVNGYKRVHKMNNARAISAYLLPLVLICIAGLGLLPHKIASMESYAINNCYNITAACQKFYNKHGRYPSSFKELGDRESPYIRQLTLANDLSSPMGDYYYIYYSSDGSHFDLYSKPAKPKISGRKIFFIDQTDVLRLNGPDGPPVKGKEN